MGLIEIPDNIYSYGTNLVNQTRTVTMIGNSKGCNSGPTQCDGYGVYVDCLATIVKGVDSCIEMYLLGKDGNPIDIENELYRVTINLTNMLGCQMTMYDALVHCFYEKSDKKVDGDDQNCGNIEFLQVTGKEVMFEENFLDSVYKTNSCGSNNMNPTYASNDWDTHQCWPYEGNDNFYEIQNVYKAGYSNDLTLGRYNGYIAMEKDDEGNEHGAVRLGSKYSCGCLKLKPMDLSNDFAVSLRVKGYNDINPEIVNLYPKPYNFSFNRVIVVELEHDIPKCLRYYGTGVIVKPMPTVTYYTKDECLKHDHKVCYHYDFEKRQYVRGIADHLTYGKDDRFPVECDLELRVNDKIIAILKYSHGRNQKYEEFLVPVTGLGDVGKDAIISIGTKSLDNSKSARAFIKDIVIYSKSDITDKGKIRIFIPGEESINYMPGVLKASVTLELKGQGDCGHTAVIPCVTLGKVIKNPNTSNDKIPTYTENNAQQSWKPIEVDSDGPEQIWMPIDEDVVIPIPSEEEPSGPIIVYPEKETPPDCPVWERIGTEHDE